MYIICFFCTRSLCVVPISHSLRVGKKGEKKKTIFFFRGDKRENTKRCAFFNSLLERARGDNGRGGERERICVRV